jgi:hypothetical protein
LVPASSVAPTKKRHAADRRVRTDRYLVVFIVAAIESL